MGQAFGVLLAGVLIMVVFGSPLSTGEVGADQVSIDIVGGSETIPTGSSGSLEEVVRARTSLNHSVRLTGASDSNVTIDSDADLGHDLSVCTFATADSSVVSNNETRLLLATESSVLWYNGTDDEWRGYYYNVSSRNSFRASVAAASPTTPTLVCLNHGSQTLNVSANTTVGTDVATGSSNTAPYPTNISNWDGTVEETRLYDSPLNSSRRSDWVTEPVLATNGSAPATRVTYDTFENSLPSSFAVYFASGSADPSNASLVTGQQGPAVSAGTDYSVSGDTLSVLSGGALEASGEVLYLDLQISGGLATELIRLSLLLMVMVGLAVAISAKL